MAGAEPVLLPATADTGFLPDLDALPTRAARRARRCSILCSPANPQGAVADRSTTCAAPCAWPAGTAFCSRSTNATASSGTRPRRPARSRRRWPRTASFDRVVVFHSLSKRSSAAGLRSGFVAGDPAVLAGPAAAARLRLAGAAAAAAGGRHRAVAATRPMSRRTARATAPSSTWPSAASANRFGFYRPAGGFFLWLDVGDGEAACRRLWREGGLRVLPGGYLSGGERVANPGTPLYPRGPGRRAGNGGRRAGAADRRCWRQHDAAVARRGPWPRRPLTPSSGCACVARLRGSLRASRRRPADRGRGGAGRGAVSASTGAIPSLNQATVGRRAQSGRAAAVPTSPTCSTSCSASPPGCRCWSGLSWGLRLALGRPLRLAVAADPQPAAGAPGTGRLPRRPAAAAAARAGRCGSVSVVPLATCSGAGSSPGSGEPGFAAGEPGWRCCSALDGARPALGRGDLGGRQGGRRLAVGRAPAGRRRRCRHPRLGTAGAGRLARARARPRRRPAAPELLPRARARGCAEARRRRCDAGPARRAADERCARTSAGCRGRRPAARQRRSAVAPTPPWRPAAQAGAAARAAAGAARHRLRAARSRSAGPGQGR